MEMNLFPNFTSIEQAAKYVHDHFRWSLRDPSAPGPKPLSSNYRGLYSRFDLRVATQYGHDSNISEIVQIIFSAMVIDEAAVLSLSRRLAMDCVIWAMRKLDWGPVEAWLGDNDRRLRIAQASHPADPPANPVLAGSPSRGRTTSFPSFHDTVQAAEYVRDNLRWSVRETSSLRPNVLPLHFTADSPEFDHIVAMQFAYAAHILEMLQAIFYDMVINDVAKLRLIRKETGKSLMLDLRTSSKMLKLPRLVETVYHPQPRPVVASRQRDVPPPIERTRSSIKIPIPLWVLAYKCHCPRPLPEDHLILCLSFDLGVATRYAQDSNIPEMVQVIFYGMVVNEVAEWGIT
ncbi:hypothetical protein Cgig2_009976 [Carnegiea gigantea]|uniref:Uncharacterized protein n=1 Tax=Carnegiea gigantea TaxID=171969 RepID=A0A9Q1Q500_9CARY|nr:hypothetical protein Cgig2_009976 [Carnegiea gigantea]